MSENIKVEVAFALPKKQKIVELNVPEGSTVQSALDLSNMSSIFPELDLTTADVGIFGKSVKRSQQLRPGDRVEIYRPLIADPKEVRKARAEKSKLKR